MILVSENESPANVSKRRKFTKPPTPSAVPLPDGKKQLLSSPGVESVTRVPAVARKAAVELNKPFTSNGVPSCFDKVHSIEASEMLILDAAQLVACAQGLQDKCSQNAALAAESHAKISKLIRDLEEAEKEVKLGKINQEIAERLAEQARQEKCIVELKSNREKACLKRKIEELETKIQQQKDRFDDALLNAEVDGYNKCVKKAKEKGLRYKKLLLDQPIDNQQEKSLVPLSAENLRDSDNVPETATHPNWYRL